MYRTVLLLMFFASPCLAADERPSYGLVYNTKENSGIHFNCSEAAYDTLQCEFKQMSVFKKAQQSELAQKIEEARQQFRTTPKQSMNPKECDEFEDTLAGIRGAKSNIKPDILASFKNKTAQELQDFDKSLAALVAFCKNPTEENLVAIARISHLKESRSCRIYASTFNQTFKRVTADSWASMKVRTVCAEL